MAPRRQPRSGLANGRSDTPIPPLRTYRESGAAVGAGPLSRCALGNGGVGPTGSPYTVPTASNYEARPPCEG